MPFATDNVNFLAWPYNACTSDIAAAIISMFYVDRSTLNKYFAAISVRANHVSGFAFLDCISCETFYCIRQPAGIARALASIPQYDVPTPDICGDT